MNEEQLLTDARASLEASYSVMPNEESAITYALQSIAQTLMALAKHLINEEASNDK